ncbi:MAG TPA: hypothetical protein VL201_05325 [Patescibacteria group bacterium]|nr:hypothetical protein [Patescibacteria group bacterium]
MRLTNRKKIVPPNQSFNANNNQREEANHENTIINNTQNEKISKIKSLMCPRNAAAILVLMIFFSYQGHFLTCFK